MAECRLINQYVSVWTGSPSSSVTIWPISDFIKPTHLKKKKNSNTLFSYSPYPVPVSPCSEGYPSLHCAQPVHEPVNRGPVKRRCCRGFVGPLLPSGGWALMSAAKNKSLLPQQHTLTACPHTTAPCRFSSSKDLDAGLFYVNVSSHETFNLRIWNKAGVTWQVLDPRVVPAL